MVSPIRSIGIQDVLFACTAIFQALYCTFALSLRDSASFFSAVLFFWTTRLLLQTSFRAAAPPIDRPLGNGRKCFGFFDVELGIVSDLALR